MHPLIFFSTVFNQKCIHKKVMLSDLWSYWQPKRELLREASAMLVPHLFLLSTEITERKNLSKDSKVVYKQK